MRRWYPPSPPLSRPFFLYTRPPQPGGRVISPFPRKYMKKQTILSTRTKKSAIIKRKKYLSLLVYWKKNSYYYLLLCLKKIQKGKRHVNNVYGSKVSWNKGGRKNIYHIDLTAVDVNIFVYVSNLQNHSTIYFHQINFLLSILSPSWPSNRSVRGLSGRSTLLTWQTEPLCLMRKHLHLLKAEAWHSGHISFP